MITIIIGVVLFVVATFIAVWLLGPVFDRLGRFVVDENPKPELDLDSELEKLLKEEARWKRFRREK